MNTLKLGIVAGEQSGDHHAASFVRELKKLVPHIEICGIGGEALKKEGLKELVPFEHLQVMGFSDVLLALPRLYKAFSKIKNEFLKQELDGIILFDYPDFNMRLAKSLRKQGFKNKIIQYTAPSVWAWKQGRIWDLERDYDLLLSILPFEKSYFERTKLAVEYIGHPLIEKIKTYQTHPVNSSLPSGKILGLFPGSRKGEIRKNLPLQLKVAKEMLKKSTQEAVLAISCAPGREELIRELTEGEEVVLVSSEDLYPLMERCQAAIATSGTIVLELALFKIPTLVVYSLSWVNFLFAKTIVRPTISNFSLPNLILNSSIFPEFYQVRPQIKEMVDRLKGLFEPTQTRQNCLNKLEDIETALGCQNASQEAAKRVLGQFLSKKDQVA